MRKKVKSLPDKEMTEQLNSHLEELNSSIKALNFPTAEVKKLSADIAENVQLLKQFAQKEVRHIHVSSIVWIAIKPS